MSSSLVASPCSSPPARAAGTRSGSSAGPECSATRTTPSRHTAATVGGLSAAKRQHARLVSSGRDDAAAVCLRDVPGRRMEEASTRWRGQLSSSDDNTAIATRCREGTTSRRRDRRRAEGATGRLGCRALTTPASFSTALSSKTDALARWSLVGPLVPTHSNRLRTVVERVGCRRTWY